MLGRRKKTDKCEKQNRTGRPPLRINPQYARAQFLALEMEGGCG
jgi:hypothetical protein